MTEKLQVKSLDSFPKMAAGAVCVAWKRCGKPNCRCVNGQQHGPYHYVMWRVQGRLTRKYLSPAEVERVRAACRERQAFQRELKDGMEQIRAMRRFIREAKSDGS